MHRIVSAALAGAALATSVAVPSAANAQSAVAQAGNYGFSKSEAILGGSSRLAAILAQQKGEPAPATLQPASLTRPTTSYAILRDPTRPSAAAFTGRPDVFGSVALRLQRSPLDRKWRKVANARVSGAPADYASSLRNRSEIERVEAVNRYVNARVSFVDDSRQYGQNDLWTTASATLQRGRGDCEDYAVAKLQMLRAAGLSDEDLYLVIVRDLVRRADHAVLVVRTGGRLLVLDNGSDRIVDADSMMDYRPVLTFASSGKWTHGYRRALPPVRVAAATVAPLAPAGLAAAD